MATLKKSARKKKTAAASDEGLQAQAEKLSRRLGESAQQVWLAGVGAFGRAQAEGGKLFETLVKEGLTLEQSTRKLAGGGVDAVRDVVENRVGQARERAADTWDRLEKVFEDRVQRALRRLEVPSREDLGTLVDRVDALNAELRNLGSGRRARQAPAKGPAARKAAKTATPKSRPTRQAAPARRRAGPVVASATPAPKRASRKRTAAQTPAE
ncbi:phasin family protein [Xanthomonas translucens]|uniref:Poly(Hydroxyalcanoate) granule associated protein n=4 Tax=Xanthomonas campestris pv. translucens TaxID=343 RepID=A0A109HHB9_XANCT|nr:phasin family protein [Xanthomonas translucens]AKK68017.1 poly(hydroxyalcanoate) granule associated protein [Xanthomonas translucens pv. undulosa]AVY66485.1 poly(hydroxyalcanoate) granule associated protein [Xanthomonas translucens pv. undulosa]ELQ11171.1 polyhydroxyalcanoate granule-associated protein [Xanthomonas translucens DAR61454]KTF39277.1 poly(hydroxyalcanoate) granule associated protein [Xanthomonas translucens pv. translucens]KWV12179.1 poly(hydroxyalcanoate) granule associated pr